MFAADRVVRRAGVFDECWRRRYASNLAVLDIGAKAWPTGS